MDSIAELDGSVLTSLARDVWPKFDTEDREEALKRWAERFHLYHREPEVGAWFVNAGFKTLLNWNGNEACKDDPPRWGEDAENFHGGILATRFASEKFTGGFRFEEREWFPETETFESYEIYIINRFLDKVNSLKRSYFWRISDGLNANEISPKRIVTKHFSWLVRYQVQGWSYKKISDQEDCSRAGVTEAIDRAAHLIFGPKWEHLKRKDSGRGRPRNRA